MTEEQKTRMSPGWARLEWHNGQQVLAVIDEDLDDDGIVIKVRIGGDQNITATYGPYETWGDAYTSLTYLDLGAAEAVLVGIRNRAFGVPEQQGVDE